MSPAAFSNGTVGGRLDFRFGEAVLGIVAATFCRWFSINLACSRYYLRGQAAQGGVGRVRSRLAPCRLLET